MTAEVRILGDDDHLIQTTERYLWKAVYDYRNPDYPNQNRTGTVLVATCGSDLKDDVELAVLSKEGNGCGYSVTVTSAEFLGMVYVDRGRQKDSEDPQS